MIDVPEKIFRQVDEILWNDWDPLGVNDLIDARDEYTAYATRIACLKNADKETITKMLYQIEMETMGLQGNISKCRNVAEKITEIIVKQ